MLKNKKSLLVMTALIRIIIALVVLFVIIIPACNIIRTVFFGDSSKEILLKLGQPDANGIYEYDVGWSTTPIWYRYISEAWEWTPYDPYDDSAPDCWMSVTETTVSDDCGGRWDGQKPVKENIEIINYLADYKPEP